MISAILLAAGMSRRMGQPKMLLPWGQTTVIEQVISVFMTAGIDDIIAYSNLIMAKGSWWEICAGVLIATVVSLILAHLLSGKLKRFPHPEKIGASMVILIAYLLQLFSELLLIPKNNII